MVYEFPIKKNISEDLKTKSVLNVKIYPFFSLFMCVNVVSLWLGGKCKYLFLHAGQWNCGTKELSVCLRLKK